MNRYSFNENDEESGEKVTINVGGVKFVTYVETLQNIADTRLTWLTENVDPEILKRKEFFFDRHPGVFVHILNYYRTGKLHTPTDICGPLFEEELQFWGVDEKQMEPCCWESFTKHREAEENLKNFVGPGFEDLKKEDTRKCSTASGVFLYDEKCTSCSFFNTKKIWKIMDEPHSSLHAKRFSLLSCLMIIVSVSMYCINTIPALKEVPIWIDFAVWLDRICLMFFTIEFSLRILCTSNKIEFCKNYRNWIDFLSVVPSYMKLIFPKNPWIQHLVIIRVLRVFKFFKLSYGLQVLLQTLKGSLHELTLLLLILLIPIVLFSSSIYVMEFLVDENEKFNSIPRSFWWCIITMTTVGYGDLAPRTLMGQVIGSVCAISGLLIIALPISVIGNNFTLYYAHARARLKLPKKNRALLQGNLRGLLRQPLSLSSRDRDRKSLRRNMNNAIRRKTDVPTSPISIRLQLRRRQAFDQISNTTRDTESLVGSEINENIQKNSLAITSPWRRNSNQNSASSYESSEPLDNSSTHFDLDKTSKLYPSKDSILINDDIKNIESEENLSSKKNSKAERDNISPATENTNEIESEDNTLHPSDSFGDQLKLFYNGVARVSDVFKITNQSVSSSLTSVLSQSDSPKNLAKLMQRNKYKDSFVNKSTPRITRRGALALQNSTDSEEESDCEYVFSPVVETPEKEYAGTFPIIAVADKELENIDRGKLENYVLDQDNKSSDTDLSLEKGRRTSMKHLTCFDNVLCDKKLNGKLHKASKSMNNISQDENTYLKNFENLNPNTPRILILDKNISDLTENSLNFFTLPKDKQVKYGSISQTNNNNIKLSLPRNDYLFPNDKSINISNARYKSENDISQIKVLYSNDRPHYQTDRLREHIQTDRLRESGV